jgi:hypothetical protein
MRGEFVSRLPKKVLATVDLERPSHIDFSRSKGLLGGFVLWPPSSHLLLVSWARSFFLF